MSAAGWTAEMTRKQQMAASRKLLSLAALSKCFSMFNKRRGEERRGAGGKGQPVAVHIFSVGSLCTRTRRGCRRPPAALKAIWHSPRRASQCRKHLHSRQEQWGERGERGQWATSVRRMPVTCFTYVCFARTKNKTSSRQNKNCLSTTITTSSERQRGKGTTEGGQRELSLETSGALGRRLSLCKCLAL